MPVIRRAGIEIAPSHTKWNLTEKVDENAFAKRLGEEKTWAEVVYDNAEYRIHFDWDKREDVEEEPDYRKLVEFVKKKFPEIKEYRDIGCAVKKTRWEAGKGKWKQSVRIFLRKLTASSLEAMKQILLERGFTAEDGWDYNIYQGKRRMLYCVNQYKDIDESKTILKIMPQYDDSSSFPVVNWMNAQVLYGDETLIKPKKAIEVRGEEKEKLIKQYETKQELNETVEEVTSYLSCITSECDRQRWLYVLIAIKSIIGDTDEAFEIAEDWSSTASTYNSRDMLYQWRSIRDLSKFNMKILRNYAYEEKPEKAKELEKRFNKDLFDTISKIHDYDKLKQVFEGRVCKITDSIRFIRKDQHYNTILNKKDLKDTYENLTYYYKDEKGNDKTGSFINKWLQDENMRAYQYACVVPPPLSVSNNTLNLWIKNKWENWMDEEGKTGSTSYIHQHIRLLSGEADDVYQHFIRLLAYKLQNPAYRTNVMVVITGEEGIGKSFFFKAIQRLWGANLCMETSSPEEHLFGTFAYMWAEKQMICINDFNPSELKKDNAERLKSLITEENVFLQRKNVNEYEAKQYCQFFAFSNKINPVPIQNGSRRYWLFEASSKMKDNVLYFDELDKWIQNDANIKAWYDELMAIDLKGYVPSKFPHTEVMEIAKQSNCSPIEQFVEDFRYKLKSIIEYRKKTEKGYKTDVVKETEGAFAVMYHDKLYMKYREWYNSTAGLNSPAYNMEKRKFQAKLYEKQRILGLEYVRDPKHGKYTYWKITKIENWEREGDEEVEDVDSETE
jgi:hypothetical protein